MRGIQVKKVTRVVVSHAEAQVVEEEKEKEREREERKKKLEKCFISNKLIYGESRNGNMER